MAYDFTKMRNILSDWNLELTAERAAVPDFIMKCW